MDTTTKIFRVLNGELTCVVGPDGVNIARRITPELVTIRLEGMLIVLDTEHGRVIAQYDTASAIINADIPPYVAG